MDGDASGAGRPEGSGNDDDAMEEVIRRRKEEEDALAAAFTARQAEEARQQQVARDGEDGASVRLPSSGAMAAAAESAGAPPSPLRRFLKRIGGHTSLRIDLRSDKARGASAGAPTLSSRRRRRGAFNAAGAAGAPPAPPARGRSLLSSVGATGSRIKLSREWGSLDRRGYHERGAEAPTPRGLFDFPPRGGGGGGGGGPAAADGGGAGERRPYFYRPRLRGVRASGGLSYDVDLCRLDARCRLRADAVGANGGYGCASAYLLPSQELSLKWRWRMGRGAAGANKLFLETTFVMPLNQDTLYRNGPAMLGVKLVYPPGCGLHLGARANSPPRSPPRPAALPCAVV